MAMRKFRMGDRLEARRDAGQQQGAVLTAEDAANLDVFASKLQEAIDLLNKEISAITKGRLNVVSEIYNDKSAILKWLELKLPLIEPFMSHKEARARGLPDLLTELKSIVSEDSALLSRMAEAAQTIVREIEKARNRNSLDGNYGKLGNKVGKTAEQDLRLDREF